MVKKYKCEVSLNAEEAMSGIVYLTKNEYEIVKRVSDPSTWERVMGGGWCGSFCISCSELDKE
jgi:hypothetical protein